MVRTVFCLLVLAQLAIPAAQPVVDHVQTLHRLRGSDGTVASTTHAPQHPLAPTNPFWFIAKTDRGAHPWMAGTIFRTRPANALEVVAWVTPAAQSIKLGAEPTWLPGFRQIADAPRPRILCDLGNIVSLAPGQYIAQFSEVIPEADDNQTNLIPTGRYYFEWNFTIAPDGERLSPDTIPPLRPTAPPTTPIAFPASLRRN